MMVKRNVRLTVLTLTSAAAMGVTREVAANLLPPTADAVEAVKSVLIAAKSVFSVFAMRK